MNTKHEGFTPGPWMVNGLEITAKDGDRWIASACDTGGVHDDEHANAVLIAAAPDLLAENERLRALLSAAVDAIQPTRDGKRDGGTFGRLSQVSDDIKAALASKDGAK